MRDGDPAPPEPESPDLGMSPEDLGRALAALQHAVAAGDLADPMHRRRVEGRLSALRTAYRHQPELFTPDTIAALKNVSDRLRDTPIHRPTTEGPSPETILRQIFGYPAFRPGQAELIRAVLDGRDAIGVLPTGLGKSLTYQISARVLGGTTLVLSPLIALMKDQVDRADAVGLRATFLNSSLPPEEQRARIARVQAGEFELVYAAPEGLEASAGAALAELPLSLIAVDEAHCISQWGHDFRPAYRNLRNLKTRWGGIPILALTATATIAVVNDIARQLGMIEPIYRYRGSFFRPNLHLHAYKKGGDDGLRGVRDSILRLVAARGGQSGLIYCQSRRTVEATALFLHAQGVRALAYHAGMEPEERTRVQDAWRRGDADVIVATVAFGMGIDKPDIRYVIHRDMPRSVEGYYQEIGRAGRDGRTSDCILFYSFADVIGWDRLVDEGAEPAVVASHRRNVRAMFRFAEGEGCRHQAIAAYFGEEIAPCKTSCDACLRADILAEAPHVTVKRVSVLTRPSAHDADAPEIADHALMHAHKNPAPKKPAATLTGAEAELFEKLKVLRRTLADAEDVPAYVIFPDATLVEIARRRPTTPEAFTAIPGIGPKRLDRYGDAFLTLLRETPEAPSPDAKDPDPNT